MISELAQAARAALFAWNRERRIARDVEELGAMDDHLLADLGIGRGQIEAYARGTHDRIADWRKPHLVTRGERVARLDLA
ncbi:MAG: DUF1127 domain-containing protein [Pikeienuella sp.]